MEEKRERISKLKDKITEIKEQKYEKWREPKKMKRASKPMGRYNNNNNKRSNIHDIGFRKREEKEAGAEKVFKNNCSNF